MHMTHKTALLAAACLTAGSASAAPLYTTDFDGPAGTQPAGWDVEEGTGLALDGNSGYAKTSGGVTRAIYEGTLDDGSAADSRADYTITSDFQITGGTSSDASIYGRYQPGTSFSNDEFYGARFSPDGNFDLFSFDPSFGTLESASVAGYDSGETWTIGLDLDGDTITATLADETGTVLSTLSETDTEIAGPGTFGVRPANAGVTYLNYTVTGAAIPEPAGLAALGGLALLLAPRRVRK